MTETTVGREPVQIVELQQPLCANTYGVSPCTASGLAHLKCYNTRATCQDTANFTLGTPLSLYFSHGNVAAQSVDGANYIIPSLLSVSTAPAKINLAGANPDAQALGTRAKCTIVLQDHQHSDRVVDPYLDDRTWDPMSRDRGSFWTRWLYRNKYRQNIVIKVYEGYAGQALSAMNVRTYFLQSVTGVDSSGRITIEGKDILARVEDRKAQAPIASPGKLYASITDSATSIEATNATEDDYDAGGRIRIDDELILYSSRANSANGVTFTVVPSVGRGAAGTEAAAHNADANVQQVEFYASARPDIIVEDLLTTYAGIDSAYLDTDGWQDEVDNYMTVPRGLINITEPTSVFKLLAQLQEQLLFYIWWDERVAKVKLRAIRDPEGTPDLLTDEAHILAGSFAIKEKPRERVSQVWFWYDIRSPNLSQTEPSSYEKLYIAANLEAETDELYGESSVRKIFGTWVGTDAVAENTADEIIARYVDTPADAQFRLDAKDRGYWVGDTVRISHYLDVDSYGDRRIRYWTIVSAEEVVPGEIVEYVAEDTTAWVS